MKPYISSDKQKSTSDRTNSDTDFTTLSHPYRDQHNAYYLNRQQREFHQNFEGYCGYCGFHALIIQRLSKEKRLPTAFDTSMFVVMAYNDTNRRFITRAPTVRRSSQRLLLCMAACASSLRSSLVTISRLTLSLVRVSLAQYLMSTLAFLTS